MGRSNALKYSSILRTKAGDEAVTLQLFAALRQLASLFAGVFIARSILSIEQVGYFEGLLFLGYLASLLWYNGLFNTFFRKMGESDNPKIHTLSSFLMIILISVSFSGVIYVFRNPVMSVFNLGEWLPSYNYFLIHIGLSNATLFIPAYLSVYKARIKAHFFNMFFFLSYIGVFFLFFIQGVSLEELLRNLLFVSAAQFTVGVILIAPYFRKVSRDLSWLKSWLTMSVPLFVYSVFSNINFSFDNWLVNWYFEDKSIYSLFRYGARELPVVQAYLLTFGTAVIYDITSNRTEGLKKIRFRVERMLNWLTPLVLLLTISSFYLFRSVYGEDYSDASFLFNLYLFILFSRILYPQSILIALNKTYFLNIALIVEIIINITLSFILVYLCGLTGIVIATVISFFAEKAVMAVYLKRKENITPGMYLPGRKYLIAIVVLLIANCAVYFIHN